jgi:NAD(P)-dependent dehydrogenase (short-subunit alcohol dehydrogenase family)
MSRPVALVTGATSDIGTAISRALAADGNAVGVHFHHREDRARALAAELEQFGVSSLVVAGDVSELRDVRRIAEELSAALGPITVLVNVAADVRFERFLDSDPDGWDRQLNVTLRGTMNACYVAAGGMVQSGGGRIVSVLAEGALVGEPALAVASVAKAGVLGLTRTLARELAPHGVTVNAVSPGFVPTDSVPRRFRTPERLEVIAAGYPMKRLGTPEDVAAAVAYLCSDGAGYVSGQTLSVSGGYSVR